MADKINIVILAAGKGTRLKLDIPKPLCPLLGETLLDFVLREVRAFKESENLEADINLIIGHKSELLKTHLETKNISDIKYTLQEQQLGTGHAVKVFFESHPEATKNLYTLILCADTPLLNASVLSKLYKEALSRNNEGIAATFTAQKPFGYGRIVHEGEGFKIVEEKDADDEVKKISEVNSGVYFLKTKHIESHIFGLSSNNKSNEFYLTDLFKSEFKVGTLRFESEDSFKGVNDLNQLEEIRKVFMKEKIEKLQSEGVMFINSDTVYIENDVQIAPGSTIYPNVYLFNGTTIGANVTIEPGVIIRSSIIEEGCNILANSYIEKAVVKTGSNIGPFARLREGTEIGAHCKIGNFVETKKSKLSEGVKVSHLSYVGDAEVGENTNIGCGFVTCNYDGKNKHKTIIGKNSFVGSDCQTVAPVSIGDDAYIGSGSTINKDVPDGAFAIARERQVTKPDMAKKFLKKD